MPGIGTVRFGPAGMETEVTVGTVKWFNPDKGFGFIHPEDGGGDVFVHVSAVEKAGLSSLQEGQRVAFELKGTESGKASADNVTTL